MGNVPYIVTSVISGSLTLPSPTIPRAALEFICYHQAYRNHLKLQKSSFFQNLKTLASELLEVAEKYQLARLLTICETELGDRLKEASVIGTLILADIHGRVCLKKACLEYIRLNSARVFKTSEWADFRDHKNQYAQLYLEVLLLEYTLFISLKCNNTEHC